MGCWNGTCMISNLPIGVGERIKVIILRPNYGHGRLLQGSSYVYSGDIFSPSFLQISGTYNDYGMIENIDKDWNTVLIEDVLKQILGKKIIIDGKEKNEYKLEDILKGIERNDLRYFGTDPEEIKMKQLAELACKTYDKHGYSSDKVKDEWKKILETDTNPRERLLNSSWVMIREDIWNYIVNNYKGEFWNPERREGNANAPYYVTAKEWCKWKFNSAFDEAKKEADLFKTKISLIKVFSDYYAGDSHLLKPILYDKLLAEANDELKTKIFEKWSEFIIINSFISGTRIGWMIQAGAGSQHEGWKEHKLLAEKIIEICNKNINEIEK